MFTSWGVETTHTFTEEQLSRIRLKLTEDSARGAVRAMAEMGVSLEEAKALLERLWKEESE